MLAKQLSKDSEIYCTADTPLTEVFKQMTELQCVCMPVVESPIHKNIIGTITEHDICFKLINDGLNPHRISASRVMSGSFTTVNGETAVEECAVLLNRESTKRLFVIDENGSFLGVLTENETKPEKPVVNLETVITEFTVTPAMPQEIHLAY